MQIGGAQRGDLPADPFHWRERSTDEHPGEGADEQHEDGYGHGQQDRDESDGVVHVVERSPRQQDVLLVSEFDILACEDDRLVVDDTDEGVATRHRVRELDVVVGAVDDAAVEDEDEEPTVVVRERPGAGGFKL